MVEPAPADLATVAARLGQLLRTEGVPAGPQRCSRFAAAAQLVAPTTVDQLFWCASATLISDPAQLPVLRRVFRLLFGGDRQLAEMLAGRSRPQPAPPRPGLGQPVADRRTPQPSAAAGTGRDDTPAGSGSYRALAAAAERLAHRDFGDLSEAELAALVAAMRRLRLSPPLRRSRRLRPASHGGRVELRATLRRAARAGGDTARLQRRRPGWRPRRLVVLCDISGSMAPYARAMLQLLYCAAGGTQAEVFTFATRLTRLTRLLRHRQPAAALEAAGQAAPDWSGGTRIGAALREFNTAYGARGMARGAVVVIVSDGWDTGAPQQLGQQMGRLSRLAYRIVWVNPRTASARYQPLAGGMAAAWPYCDAVVSGHRLAALDELVAVIAAPRLPQPAGDRRWAPNAGADTLVAGDSSEEPADA